MDICARLYAFCNLLPILTMESFHCFCEQFILLRGPMALISTVLIFCRTSFVDVGVFFLPTDNLSLSLVQELFSLGRCHQGVHVRHTCLGCLVSDHLEGRLAHFYIKVLFNLLIISLVFFFFISHEVDLEIFIVVLNFTFVLFIDLTEIVAIFIFRDSV